MTTPRKTLGRWIWIGSGMLLLVFLLVAAWPRPTRVELAVIDRGVVRHELVDEGRVRVRDVYTVAAPVGGALQRVRLEPGDAVAAGDTVAVIVPADPALLDARIAAEARAAVAAATAAVEVAESELALAAAEHARVARLKDEGYMADAALDRSAAALAAARAAVSLRRAELDRERAAAGQTGPRATRRTDVPSPVAGQVLHVVQESEAVVAAGMPILAIGDLADSEVVAEFLSQDAIRMRPGMVAFVEAWGGDAAIPARLQRIEPFARTKVSALGVEEQRVNVVARFADPTDAPGLGHDYRVDLRVRLLEEADVLRVPVDALVRDGPRWAVFRMDGDRARFTPVQIQPVGDRYRRVIAGLAAGDKVILFPGDALRDGDRVAAR